MIKDTMMSGFGQIEQERVLVQDDLFVVAYDKYPVSRGHTLIIARRQVVRFSDLTPEEMSRLLVWVDWTIQHLSRSLPKKPDGFTLGLNDGTAAGQTVQQLHFHVIPRHYGDVPDPRGGIRSVIPSKACYWE